MNDDLISRQAAIRFIRDKVSLSLFMKKSVDKADKACVELCDMLDRDLPSAQPEIIRCHQCRFWDRETLQHQFNDFRDWNEAECLILAERDAYHEINRYTEADDYCSRAERREDDR